MDLTGIIRETASDIRKPLDQMAVDVNEAMDTSRKPYTPPRQMPKPEEIVEGEAPKKVDVIPPEPTSPPESTNPTEPTNS